MKPLIVANWKCNPATLEEAEKLFSSIGKGIRNIKNTEVVICPPFLYIPKIQNTPKQSFQDATGQARYKIQIGAQDCFWEQIGAFTGEVSPKMLKDLGCQYVILGHSERRRHLGETDEMVNKKLKATLKEKLTPILCVANLSQVKKDLRGISDEDFKKIIVAYEPIFAIGTGNPCSLKKAEKTRFSIQTMNKNLTIIYGGSVNSQNAKDYIKKAGFYGLLVGGVSLEAKEFIRLVKNLANT